MDDLELLQKFAASYLSGRSILLSNSDLRVEPISNTLQLLAKTEGLVATAKLSGNQRSTSIRCKSTFWPQLHKVMVAQQCLPIRKSKISGFYDYEAVQIPENYRVCFTDSLELLQTWWRHQKSDHQASSKELLVLHRQVWQPIQALSCEQGTLTIQTLDHQIQMFPLDKLVWLQAIEHPSLPLAPQVPQSNSKTYRPQQHPQAEQPEQSWSRLRQAVASDAPDNKRIGNYLLEAGLLSPGQVDVVLSDQKLTGMRFGEILVSRGWLKSQTIEFLFQNVILPQRILAKQAPDTAGQEIVDRLTEASTDRQVKLAQSPFKDRRQQSSPQKAKEELGITPNHALPLQTSASSQPITNKPQLSSAKNRLQPVADQPTPPRLLSIHDRETLATCDKLNLEDLPDWLEMDSPD